MVLEYQNQHLPTNPGLILRLRARARSQPSNLGGHLRGYCQLPVEMLRGLLAALHGDLFDEVAPGVAVDELELIGA